MRVFPSLVISGAYHKNARAAMSLKQQKGSNVGRPGNNSGNGATSGSVIDGNAPVKNPDGLTNHKPSAMTEKQWQAKFADVAIKAAKSTDKDGKYDENVIAALRKDYVSTVSPDRVKVINNAALTGTASGMYYDGETPVAYFSKDGWHSIPTPAEISKGKSFDAAFKKYYTDALAAIKNDTAPPMPTTAGKSAFSSKA